MTNILTPRQECNRGRHGFDLGRDGEVRRCKHGAYFIFNGSGWPLNGAGYWERLHPILDPVRYWRAVKALRRAS